MLKRLIYSISIIAIAYTIIEVITKKIPDMNAQWSVVLAAIALIALPNIKIVKKRKNDHKYLYDYNLFVDRYSHIKALLNIITKKRRTIVNVHGISGIGITKLLQITADIINKKAPLGVRLKYWKSAHAVFKNKYLSVYINVSKFTNIESMLDKIYDLLFLDKLENKKNISEDDLLHNINTKYKRNNIAFFFDEVVSKEQMFMIDDFINSYFTVRLKGT